MGGSFSGTRVSVQVLMLAALTVTLFAAARYVPVLGLLVSLLAPTPILLVDTSTWFPHRVTRAGSVDPVSRRALW